MRTFIVVFVLIFAFVIRSEGNPEKFVKILGACKEKIKPSDEDIIQLMKHAPPTTKTQKCFMNCMFEGMGFVS